ncbi:MAG: hypothetical protein ACYS9X_12615, partial [Planctomycetota bacterium]
MDTADPKWRMEQRVRDNCGGIVDFVLSSLAPITVHFLMLKTSADGAKKRGSNLRRDDNRG